MAWKGVGDDQALFWARNDGFGWGSQSRVNDVGSDSRPALAQFNGKLYMVWKGVEGDSGIFWSTFNGAGWAPQRGIRGVGTSDTPALVVFRDQLHMFWKGVPGDTNVYHSTLDNGEGAIWQAQQKVSYIEAQTDGMVAIDIGTSSAPSACVRGDRILLAWKGALHDSGIYFSLFDGRELTGQIQMEGVGTSHGPAVLEFGGQAHLLWKGVDQSNLFWSRL